MLKIYSRWLDYSIFSIDGRDVLKESDALINCKDVSNDLRIKN